MFSPKSKGKKINYILHEAYYKAKNLLFFFFFFMIIMQLFYQRNNMSMTLHYVCNNIDIT